MLIERDITWEEKVKCRAYQAGSRKCDLCAAEKISIVNVDSNVMPNKRNEKMAKCRHRGKFLLWNFNPPRRS